MWNSHSEYFVLIKDDFIYSHINFNKERETMKKEKLVIPALLIVVILVLYFSYFNPKDELGLFSEFDTNSNANKEILVKVLPEKGFVQDGSVGTVFYVEDRAAKQVKVSGPLMLPAGIDVTSRVVLSGHYSGDSFHAHEVKIKN